MGGERGAHHVARALAHVLRPALGEDARDFLADLSRFTSLEMDAEGDEEDERALVELTEFTRMGVMLVRAELNESDGDEDEAVTLH